VSVAGVAGSALALAASPALAATNFTLQSALADFGTREWLLAASLVLLVIALVGRLARNRTSPRATMVDDTPDLRWWRNDTLGSQWA